MKDSDAEVVLNQFVRKALFFLTSLFFNIYKSWKLTMSFISVMIFIYGTYIDYRIMPTGAYITVSLINELVHLIFFATAFIVLDYAVRLATVQHFK